MLVIILNNVVVEVERILLMELGFKFLSLLLFLKSKEKNFFFIYLYFLIVMSILSIYLKVSTTLIFKVCFSHKC